VWKREKCGVLRQTNYTLLLRKIEKFRLFSTYLGGRGSRGLRAGSLVRC
jgi:hypothetical protein